MTSGDPAADARGVDPTSEPAATELPRGWRAVGKGSETVHTVGDPVEDVAEEAVRFAGDEEAPVTEVKVADAENLSLSNASLLGIGVFAGVYLIFTLGWLFAADKIAPVAPILVGGDIHFQILKWMAIAAPFIWFVVTFVLTRHSKAWKRFTWLTAGVLLLAPWPALANLTGGAL